MMMMSSKILLLAVLSVALAASTCSGLDITDIPLAGTVQAGVAKINGTLPLGVPLAGYNHGARRVKLWPLPDVKEYTTFMTGNVGHINPTWCKALAISDGATTIMFVTLDGIGADGSLMGLAFDLAKDNGLKTPLKNIMFHGSHSHSGPGAVSPELLWALAPATDFLVPEVQNMLASSIARAMVEAEQSMQPATVGTGITELLGVTKNRRARISPYLNSDSIDPNLAVIRVDDASSGKPIATLWQFAIHGVCYGPDNMMFSSDIMGRACDLVEEQVGGVALFINGDAGDIDPNDGMCDNKPDFAGSPIMAKAVVENRQNIKTEDSLTIKANTLTIDFGPTDLNYTLARFNNCTSGGPLDVCSICEVLRCDFNAHLPDNWVEDHPRFSSFIFETLSKKTAFVSMPGEPLLDLGWMVRNDTQKLGFDETFLCGYTNSHMGYFATPPEYDLGGYESQLTFWGIDTAQKVADSVHQALVSTM